MVLDVWRLPARLRADEGTRFKMVRCAKACLEEEPTCADQEFTEQAEFIVQADRLFAVELEVDFKVVLKILTNPRHDMMRRDADVFQKFFWPNTRTLHNHRRGN